MRPVCLLIALACAITAPVRAGDLMESIDQEVRQLFQGATDAIIKVHAQRHITLNQQAGWPAHRVGTGFFIDPEGRLLTAGSVVADAETCWIEWEGERIPAQLLGQDPQTNLALLKIDRATPALPLGNSDEIRTGAMVVTIGYPYDLPQSPVVGFVGGRDIQQGTRVLVTSHLRASCRLSPGQAGAPMLNARGEVIGVAVAAHMQDQCYAMPINAARRVCADIQQHGQPCHPWVGLSVAERRKATPDAAPAETEVYVQQVISNTPASKVGFQAQDIVRRIGTNAVDGVADVMDAMFQRRTGDQVTIVVERDHQEIPIAVTVGERPSERPAVVEFAPLEPVEPARRPPLILIPATKQR